MPEPRIRRATVADAVAIKRVHVRAWQETYADHLPASFLDSAAEVIKVEIWESNIRNDANDVFVAEADGEVVGWAKASSGRDGDAPADRELEGIYVLEAHYGTGAGQLLLDAVLEGRGAYLWVVEGNPRAEAFYARNGFVRDGSGRAARFGEHAVDTVRMVRRGEGGAASGA